MNWIGLHIRCSHELKEILLAELSQLPFSTFEETDDGLSAYCEIPDWNEVDAIEILKRYEISNFNYTKVERVNWNEEWEKNYDPIHVRKELTVRAPFHPPSEFPREIVILPKMSFGTGHHATTYLVLDYQLNLDQSGKKVLDVGCGTGVLAIMAHKQGARDVQAIDIGDWCVENSQENFALNDCSDIIVEQKEIYEVADNDFDIVLANITKGVHFELMDEYMRKMNPNGTLVLSGFFDEDIHEVQQAAERSGFKFVDSNTHNDWARLVCRKQ